MRFKKRTKRNSTGAVHCRKHGDVVWGFIGCGHLREAHTMLMKRPTGPRWGERGFLVCETCFKMGPHQTDLGFVCLDCAAEIIAAVPNCIEAPELFGQTSKGKLCLFTGRQKIEG